MKVDIVIFGSLDTQAVTGGIYTSREIPDGWDISDAVRIDGDVTLGSVDTKGRTVLVIGRLTAKREGGHDGAL